MIYTLDSGFKVLCVPDGKIPEIMKKLEITELKLNSDDLEPLDITVPEKFASNDYLIRCWVFGEVRKDAWFRNPPKDIPAWEKENDMVWKDIRVFDVERGNV